MINVCTRCLLSRVSDLVLFISNVLVEATKQNAQIIQLLLPYTCYIQTRSLQPNSDDLKTLNNILTTYLNNQKLPPPPPENMHAPLSQILLEAKKFDKMMDGYDQKIDKEKIENENINRIVSMFTVEQTSSNLDENSTKAMSLSKRLDLPYVPPVLSSQPSTNEPASKNKGDAAANSPYIEITASKLGGFQHNTWQTRYFQYYRSNRCLVWRTKNTLSDVKGLMLFDSKTQIEMLSKGLKGKQFVLRIQLDKKVHEISFPSQEKLDEWFNAMTGADQKNR